MHLKQLTVHFAFKFLPYLIYLANMSKLYGFAFK